MAPDGRLSNVIPLQSGIHASFNRLFAEVEDDGSAELVLPLMLRLRRLAWIPAFAGMTE